MLSIKCTYPIKSLEFGFILPKLITNELNGFNHKIIEPLSFKLFHPFYKNYLNDNIKMSLSESIDYDNQIRFFLKLRTERNIKRFFHILTKKFGPFNVTIFGDLNSLSNSDKFLVSVAAKCYKVKISILSKRGSAQALPKNIFSKEEIQIQDILKKAKISKEDISFLISASESFIHVGDGWSSEVLLQKVFQYTKNKKIHYLMSFSLNMQNRSLEAEYYFNQWKENGNNADLVQANYMLSMLYLRHHPKHLLSIEKASSYLQKAYNVLLEDKNISLDTNFEKVFNRNGYALVLFKKGHVESALALLKEQLQILNMSSEKHFMHKTVIMYNLAQCYLKMGNTEDAIRTFEELINLDPLFPEYQIELAQVIANIDPKRAIEIISKSLNLDPIISENYSTLGYCYDKLNQLKKSEKNYAKAYQLDNNNLNIVYNYVLSLIKNYHYDLAISILDSTDYSTASENQFCEFALLRVECDFNIKRKKEAILYLEKLTNEYPTHGLLKDALNKLKQHE